MPEPRRTPWIAIDVDIRKDDRIADLPSDAARWGYVAGVLAESRLQDPRGVFGSRATFEEAVGRFARYLDQYLAVGLMERAPKLCDGCRDRFGELRNGAIVVHNWHRKQADPTHAERQQRHRMKRVKGRRSDGDGDGEVTDNGVTITSHSDGSTRARAETPDTRHQTETPEKESPSPDGTPRATPSRPPVSIAESFLGIEPDDPRHPVAVVLASRYRWRRVTEEQWDRLWAEVDNEYPSGTSKGADPRDGWRWLASWLANLPRDAGDPMAALFARQQQVKAERQADADRRAEVHQQQKRATLHPSLGGAS